VAESGAGAAFRQGARTASPRSRPADRPGDADDGLRQAKCALPPLYFTDYLSFLKIEGKWQVAQKVFARERRPSAQESSA
jgi:hypothetical protein